MGTIRVVFTKIGHILTRVVDSDVEATGKVCNERWREPSSWFETRYASRAESRGAVRSYSDPHAHHVSRSPSPQQFRLYLMFLSSSQAVFNISLSHARANMLTRLTDTSSWIRAVAVPLAPVFENTHVDDSGVGARIYD